MLWILTLFACLQTPSTTPSDELAAIARKERQEQELEYTPDPEDARRGLVSSRHTVAAKKGQAAIAELAETLKGHLGKAMKEGGPTAAVQVCASSAQALTAQVASSRGVQLGRTSVKTRNPDNAGPEWVARWLLAQDEVGGKPMDDLIRTATLEDGTEVVRRIRPIYLAEKCLVCHGDPDTMDPTVKDLITASYPEDQATGYAKHDLRGAFWAQVEVEPAPPAEGEAPAGEEGHTPGEGTPPAAEDPTPPAVGDDKAPANAEGEAEAPTAQDDEPPTP